MPLGALLATPGGKVCTFPPVLSFLSPITDGGKLARWQLGCPVASSSLPHHINPPQIIAAPHLYFVTSRQKCEFGCGRLRRFCSADILSLLTDPNLTSLEILTPSLYLLTELECTDIRGKSGSSLPCSPPHRNIYQRQNWQVKL